MLKSFESKLSLKFFAIALAVMMAASVLPVALAGQPTDCEHEDCVDCEHAHECADVHSHETCASQHGHEACACGHHHDEAEHDHETESITAFAYPGDEIYSAPSPTKPSGFPVWLDAQDTNVDSTESCGFEPDTSCAYCSGNGWNTCGDCGGSGDVTCPTCGGSGIEFCASCGGSGWETCWDCGGFGTTTCSVCSGTLGWSCALCGGDGELSVPGDCYECGGDGFVDCTNCFGTGTESCWTCSGMGGWSCWTCGGVGSWSCAECGGDGDVMCLACDGDGMLDCTVCGADGLIDKDYQLAQEFVPTTSGQVDRVRVMIANPNSFVSDIRFYLCDNDTRISDIVSISGDEVGTVSQWVDVEFHDSVVLTAGVTYFIVAEADEYDWRWSTDWSNTYPAGSAWGATSDTDWAILVSTDMVFQVYLTTVHNKIYTLQQLQDINLNLTGNFQLMNDIDASETAGWYGGLGFVPIGDTAIKFTGQFEGDGHVISGLYINRPTDYNIGLFGRIGPAGSSGNVSLLNVNICGDYNVGGLVGLNDGEVTNCSTAGIITGNNDLGGLVGRNQGTIIFCSSTCSVSGNNYVGGFIGDNQGVIEKCYSSGPVSAYATVGGFIGYNYNSNITDCYSTGSSSGTLQIGGFIGLNDIGTLNRCYSSGASSENGFIGSNSGGNVMNSFWDTETSGTMVDLGANDRTTAQMMTQTTFSVPGWDFTNVWWMVDGQTRPFLRMEFSEEITNSHQLQMMQMDLTADYTLENDIDLSEIIEPSQMWGTSPSSGKGWWPMGSITVAFTGTLDGNGHEISNLYIERPTEEGVALFNYVKLGAELHDFNMTAASVTGYYPVGGVAANSRDSFYSNISVDGNFISTDEEVGALIGYNLGGWIENCSSSGNVTGVTYYIGGLVGGNGNTGTIIDCHSSARVIALGGATPNYTTVGGLVGENSGAILRSYATGDVSGKNYTGGFVGSNSGPISYCYALGNIDGISYVGGFVGGITSNLITDCYARGNVIGIEYAGGFIGRIGNVGNYVSNSYSSGAVIGGGGFAGTGPGTASNCFWDTETSGQNTSAGGAGVLGRTTAEMMTQSTFTNAGWDFTTTWGIVEDIDYPVLMAMAQSEIQMWLTSDLVYGTVGSPFTYYVNMFNHGPDHTMALEISLLMPAECSYADSTPNGTVDGRWVNMTLENLAPGTGTTVEVVVNVNTFSLFPMTCEAWVDSLASDPGQFPNHDIRMNTMNRAPNAVDDNYTASEDSIFYSWVPAGVLANDGDPDGTGISVDSADLTGTIGSILGYPNGSFQYDPTGVAAFQALDNGQSMNDYFNYTITDSYGGYDIAMVTITVNGANDAPVISTADVTTAVINTPYSVDYNANDPESDVLTWALATNAAWLSINNVTGVLSGTPTVTGTFWANVSVSDGALSAWSNFTLTVTDPNSPPIISTANMASAYVGTMYSVDYDATDADGDALTWGLTTDASWLTIDSNGILSGIPALANVGTYSVNVLVSDGNGGSDFTEFTLTVINNNRAPVITTTNVLTATVGAPYSVDYAATDADGDTLAWARQTNATWLSINSATGVLFGTPTIAGTFWVNVTVSDGNGGLAWRHFTIAVSPADPVDDDDDDVEEETIDVIIGPLLDANGDPISGALVTVTIGNATYTGTTGADGNATITLPETALGEELDVAITKNGYSTLVYTATLAQDGILGQQPPVMEYSDLGEDDQRYDYTWMFIILILVVVIVIGAVWWFKPKVPKPAKFDPQPAPPEEEPPNFNTNPSDATNVEPKENIVKDGAVTYVESQTPYDRLG